MDNIYDMLARTDILDEIMENERKEAAKRLQNEVCTFVAHYGYASTDECPSTWRTYTLLRDGLILRKREEDEGETITTKDLSLVEMGFIHEFMVDTFNRDSKYIEEEVERFIDIYQYPLTPEQVYKLFIP